MIIGPSGSGKDTLISGAKLLLDNENLDNLKIFPINIGQDNYEKAKKCLHFD